MNISAILRADACGLGTLSRMFHNYLGLYRTISVQPRHDLQTWPSWFKNNRHVTNTKNTPENLANFDWLLDGADVLLFFETPYTPFLPMMARQRGVTNVLMPMYECTPMTSPWFQYVDACACPSLLDYEEMVKTEAMTGAQKAFVPVPCDTARLIPRNKRSGGPTTFFHHMGRGGIGGRNSTAETIEAWKYVKSDARLVLRHQKPLPDTKSIDSDDRISVVSGEAENYWDLWDVAGDVYIHLTKWDALSLPIQEAVTCGMPVMTTDRWPFFGERGWLGSNNIGFAVSTSSVTDKTISRRFLSYNPDPKSAADQVDRIVAERGILAEMSGRCLEWANRHSWESMKPLWMEFFEDAKDRKCRKEYLPAGN